MIPFPLLLMVGVNTLSLRFEREFGDGHSKELVKGAMYFQAPEKVVLTVSEPVNQVMVVTPNAMTIYYPDEKKGFHITSKNPIPPPFIQGILAALKEDYGLVELGFELAEHGVKGDTLFTTWTPRKKHKKFLGRFVLGRVGDKVVYAEVKTPDEKYSAKSFYRNHVSFEGKHIPLEIFSITNDESGAKVEHVTYREVQFNTALPDSLINFRVPAGVPVKEVEW